MNDLVVKSRLRRASVLKRIAEDRKNEKPGAMRERIQPLWKRRMEKISSDTAVYQPEQPKKSTKKAPTKSLLFSE